MMTVTHGIIESSKVAAINVIYRAVPLDFAATINIEVSSTATFRYSLDNGITWANGNGTPFTVSGVPSADILISDPYNVVYKVNATTDRYSAITVTEPWQKLAY